MKRISLLLAVLFAAIGIVGCASEPQRYLIKSGLQYSKPANANELIKGKNVNYELWFNNGKWRVVGQDKDTYQKFEKEILKFGGSIGCLLVHKSENVLSMALENRTAKSLNKIANGFNKAAFTKGQQIISQDLRIINNKEVLYIKSILGNDGIKNIELYYFLSNKTGIALIYVFTSERHYAAYESDMFDLLNGLVDPNFSKK